MIGIYLILIFLAILFSDGNQVDDEMAWGLGEGFLCIIQVLSANTSPFLTFDILSTTNQKW